MTPYQKKLKQHLIIALLSIIACSGMILISEIAHQARKPKVRANVYPTINNFDTIKKQINDL
jgi:hypothetical protein